MQVRGLESQILLDAPDVSIRLLRFASGHELPEHIARRPIAIQVLRGEGEFSSPTQCCHLEQGVFITLRAEEPHSVRAGKQLDLLLTTHKLGGAEHPTDAPVRVISPNRKPEVGVHPLETLLDCHRRHEQFIKVIRLLVKRPAAGKLEAHEESALDLALRFFQENRPLHHEDEEVSIFARLQGTSLAPKLKKLCAEHKRLSELHGQFEPQLQLWIAQEGMNYPQRRALEETVDELNELFTAHRAVEEGEVFPFARQSFAPEVWEKISQEFAARRK